jgi:hypothetical protein
MIPETYLAYGKGYKAAERDAIAIVTHSLWEEVKRLQRAFPDLSEGLQVAIDVIESKFPEQREKTKK